MELTASELWSRILDSAKGGVPEQSFATWLAGTDALSLTDSELHVEAPSQFHVEWIEDKYGPSLTDAASQIVGRPLTLRFHARTDGPLPIDIPSVELGGEGWRDPAPEGAESEETADPDISSHLNERYTFKRFVVGNNNELAAAACEAVADKPARMYNPLFLYGGVGLGKTHLMHAIGNKALADNGASRIAYIPCEQFVNELVYAIRTGTTQAFRRKYRQVDVLFVDDIHFLEGKERTQEEFFHTFNALYDAKKQIVLASDRPPKELPGIEARLVSRFEWGLVADLKPPDYETRVAILRKKAADDGLILDDEVMDFIARSCTASVRELEGAVLKLLAYSSLTHREVTVDLARTALKGMIQGEGDGPRLDVDAIKQAVAEAWDVTVKDLTSKRRTKDVMIPRQTAMYLIRDLLDLPLAKIGDAFGGRDHSTVINSISRVEEALETDAEFRERFGNLRHAVLRR